MRFLEHPGLSRLSVLLKDLDVGDRILCGRLELFSTEDDECKTDKALLPERKNSCDPETALRHSEGRSEEKGSVSQEHDNRLSGSEVQEIVDLPSDVGPRSTFPSHVKHLDDVAVIRDLSAPLSHMSCSDEDISNAADLSPRKRSRSRCLSDAGDSFTSKRQRSSVSSVKKFLGRHTPAEARKLLVQLVNTMNACFPDYDFRYVPIRGPGSLG